jgi:hypothetical protein
MVISAARPLALGEPPISKRLARAEFAAWLPSAPDALRTEGLTVMRAGERTSRAIDVAHHLDGARIVDGDEAALLRRALGWADDGAIVSWRTKVDNEGGARPVEVIAALTGAPPAEGVRFARTGLWSISVGGERVDLMEPLAAPAATTPSAPDPLPADGSSEVFISDAS